MIRIRLLSAPKPVWHDPRIEFSPEFPADDCDGLLVWGAMRPEFFNYHGPRAWFIDEPRTQGMFGRPLFRRALRELEPREFLHHSNSDPQYRFPCATHYGEPTIVEVPQRKNAAIAVANNFGGRLWWFRENLVGLATSYGPGILMRHGIRLRNRFLVHPDVELYGNPEVWSGFRRTPWSKPAAPPSYRGPLGGSWLDAGHIQGLAQYRVNVCMENATLPYYFTEKLVNAARAGCIPIYHAHPTVRQEYLQGAAWIDPEDYGFDPAKTLAAAMTCDAEKIRAQNYEWLKSDPVKSTEGFAIWSRMAKHFKARIAGTG